MPNDSSSIARNPTIYKEPRGRDKNLPGGVDAWKICYVGRRSIAPAFSTFSGENMKRTPLLLCMVVAFTTPSLAQMSEADRLARCANNQARIDALQHWLDGDKTYMSDEELARARTRMMSARKIEVETVRTRATLTNDATLALWTRLQGMNRGLHISESSCEGVPLFGDKGIDMVIECAGMIRSKLSIWIDLHNGLRKHHTGIEAEIARHRANVTALQCGAAATLNIAGTWYREGDRSKPASVSGSGAGLVFVNEFGMRARGHVSGPNSVVADDWEGGLVGIITDGGRRIAWGNNTNWMR